MDYEAKKQFIVNTFFILLIFGLVFFVSKFLFAYLLPFVIGLSLAFIMQKPSKVISKKTNISSGVIASILVLITFTAISGLFTLIMTQLIIQITNLFSELPKYFDGFFSYISSLLDDFNSIMDNIPEAGSKTLHSIVNASISNFTSSITSIFSSAIAGIAKNLPSFMVSTVITIVASCYFAKDFEKIIKFFRNLLKNKTYKNAVRLKNILSECILKFGIGYLILIAVTFIELFIGLLILKVHYALAFAALIAIIDVFPVLGTGTVLLPWAALSFILGNSFLGIGLIVLYIVISVVRNFLEPRIIGKQMGLHPIIALLSMFLGLKLFGIVGMILSPVLVIVFFNYYKDEIVE